MGLYMPPHIFRLTTFRVPPKVEIGPDGKPRLVWVFNKCIWPCSERGPAVKLKILNPLNARLRTTGTVSRLRQLGHRRAAPRLLSITRSMEAPFIHSVQDIQLQVPAFMVEGFQMRSGLDRMTVCYPHFNVRKWAGLHLDRCLRDIQWAAGGMEASYSLKLGRRCTHSLDAGRDSHMNHRPRQTPPLVVYIQNVQGYQ